MAIGHYAMIASRPAPSSFRLGSDDICRVAVGPDTSFCLFASGIWVFFIVLLLVLDLFFFFQFVGPCF